MELDRPVATGALVAMLWRTTLVLLLSTLVYFLMPRWADWSPPDGRPGAAAPAQLVGSLVVFVALVAFLARTVARSRRERHDPYARVQWLLTALYLLILGSAVVYRLLALSSPGSFSGLTSRVDALYFTVTLTATVGFGDVHPVGTLARAVVTAHMLLNLIYLGTAVRLLGSGAGRSPSPDSATSARLAPGDERTKGDG